MPNRMIALTRDNNERVQGCKLFSRHIYDNIVVSTIIVSVTGYSKTSDSKVVGFGPMIKSFVETYAKESDAILLQPFNTVLAMYEPACLVT